MKIIMTSDTHKNRKPIESVTQFAQDNGINTIVDCGDLHGCIEAYKGIDLHAVYWKEASGAMDRWDFERDIRSINGAMHENGSVFSLADGTLFYIKHNLADYKDIIPEKAREEAKEELERVVNGDERKFVAFGHTHNFHYNNEDGITAINPGSLGLGKDKAFVILDTETGELEYRNLEETILKIDKDFEFSRVRSLHRTGKDSVRFIGKLKSSGKEVIQTGDQRTAEHKKILGIQAIIDGTPMYTAVLDNDNQVLVCNGEIVAREYKEILRVQSEYENHELVGVEVFSAVKDNDKQVYVLPDGTESREFHKIVDFKGPHFIDGKLCFVAKNHEKGKDLVILGDKTIGQYKSVSQIVPLEDKVAVIVNRKFKSRKKANPNASSWASQQPVRKQYIDFDGKKTKMYEEIDRSNVKLVGGTLAFIAKEGEESFVVHNGVEGPRFNTEGWDNKMSQLTDVGGRVGYIYKHGNESKVIVDGKVVRDGAGVIQFTQLHTGAIIYQIRGEEHNYIEVAGKEFKEYDQLDTFIEAYNNGEV